MISGSLSASLKDQQQMGDRKTGVEQRICLLSVRSNRDSFQAMNRYIPARITIL
jgi:hypothetical protein